MLTTFLLTYSESYSLFLSVCCNHKLGDIQLLDRMLSRGLSEYEIPEHMSTYLISHCMTVVVNLHV